MSSAISGPHTWAGSPSQGLGVKSACPTKTPATIGQKKSRPLCAVGSTVPKVLGSHLHPFKSTLPIQPYVTDDQNAQEHEHAHQRIHRIQSEVLLAGRKQHG